jgi:hypothetical protein
MQLRRNASLSGLLVTQKFEALDPERTRVRTKVEMPLNGMMRFLAPLVRMGLRRDLAIALEEDASIWRSAVTRKPEIGAAVCGSREFRVALLPNAGSGAALLAIDILWEALE